MERNDQEKGREWEGERERLREREKERERERERERAGEGEEERLIIMTEVNCINVGKEIKCFRFCHKRHSIITSLFFLFVECLS